MTEQLTDLFSSPHPFPSSSPIRHVGLDKLQDRSHFEEEVWSYFAMGVQLQELYISPDCMTGWAYDVIAAGAKWARARAASLQRSHWIGGNAVNLQAYGFASWHPSSNDCNILLRNPQKLPQTVKATLGAAFELPAAMLDDTAAAWHARLRCRCVAWL